MPVAALAALNGNINITGNTISTVNPNGNLTFDLNGTGALIFNDLTATTVPILDASKKLVSSSTTPTQLGYLGVVTSNLCGINQSCTLTNKTLTAPAISSPTGLVKADVGLGNVDNTSDATKNSAAATLTNKILSGNTAVTLISGSGTITHNTTGNMTVPNGTDTLVALALSQTLTNKTITAPAINGANISFGTASNTNRLVLPTNTTSNFAGLTNTQGLLAYDTTLNKPVYNDGTAWTAVGSGSGGGGGSKNYLGSVNGVAGNGDFETASATPWIKVTTTMTGVIPNATAWAGGATSVTTFATSATSPLSGANSLNVASSGAWTAGQGFKSADFTIDPSDAARVHTVKFNYRVNSGLSNMNFSGTSANTFGIYILNVTDSVWIQPAGVYSMNQGSGIGSAQATFQTASSATQYAVFIFCVNATAGAVNMTFDDFSLGPQTTATGVPAFDAKDCTATGTWAVNTTYTCKVARRADRAFFELRAATSAAPTATALVFTLPTGMVIDTTKMVESAAGATILNSDGVANDSGTNVWRASAFYESSTTIRAGYANTAADQMTSVTNALPFSFGAGDSIVVRFDVPIVGWSSNVQMSSDTDTRVVAARLAGWVSGGLTSTATAIAFASTPTDTHSAVSSNTTVTIPVSGYYDVEAQAQMAANVSNASAFTIDVYNVTAGAQVVYNTIQMQASVGTTQTPKASLKAVYFNAGTQLQARTAFSSTTSNSINNGIATYFTVVRTSGPATIAGSESVNASYMSNAGTAIGTSATIVPFNVKEWDSHSAWNVANANAYTAPVSGKYQISLVLTNNGVTLGTSQGFYADVFKNGVFYKTIGWASGSGGGNNHRAIGSVDIELKAGEYFDIRATSSVATTLITTGSYNSLAVKRVGN